MLTLFDQLSPEQQELLVAQKAVSKKASKAAAEAALEQDRELRAAMKPRWVKLTDLGRR